MKKEDLQAGLKEAGVTDEVIGTIDVDKLNTLVNEDTNNVVASKKDDFLKQGREEGQSSFLTAKGFETVEKFDAFVETAKKDTDGIKKDYTKLQDKHNLLVAAHDKQTGEITTGKEISKLESHEEDGFRVDKKYSKFVHAEIKVIQASSKANGKELTLEEATKGYLEKNPQYQTARSTGTRRKGPVVSTGADVDSYYKDRYNKRKK